MAPKQSTIGEILESEHSLVLEAPARYGGYYANALEFNLLMSRGIKSIKHDRAIFAAFLSHVRKHHLLAIFSIVRLHHVQAMMDLRQTLEAGASAAYAIANIDPSDFAEEADGVLEPSQKLTNKRHKWLDEHFKKGSDGIRNLKGQINSAAAHANIVYAHNTFNADFDGGRFDTPFFDDELEHIVKTNLWMAANIALGLLDLFAGVNKSIGAIVFADDFEEKLLALARANDALKTEMQQSDWYKRIAQRAQK